MQPNLLTMQKDIHPANYRTVIFKDMTNESMWLGKSTAATQDTEKWEDGTEYPVVKLEISYKSHPFFTGKLQFVDTAGRIDKFKTKYKKFSKKEAAPAQEDSEES